MLQVLECFYLDLSLGVEQEYQEDVQELRLPKDHIFINRFFIHKEILNSVEFLRLLVNLTGFKQIWVAELLDKCFHLVNLREKVFKNSVGISILAPVVHVYEARVESV